MKFYCFSFLLLVLLACKQTDTQNLNSNSDQNISYIKQMNWENRGDSLIIKSENEQIIFKKEDLPIQSAMVIPTSVIAYLDELNSLDKIKGVSQPDFIFNQKIHTKLNQNEIEVIGTFNEIFIERVLVQQPDVFISTSSPTLAKFHELLKKQNIKVLLIDEYEELNPLAKAEYIKLMGILVGKEKEAETIFMEIEKNYLEIQNKVKNSSKNPPKILTNHMYGDVWYMPAGESFQSILFEDAGGQYLWASSSGKGALNLSFETVFEKANDADVWMNAGDFPSKAALLASFPNYNWFKSFQNGRIYNWNKRKSATGANDYFETGTARPDWVLKDLAAIFHPELFPGHELVFYEKLE
ncbi:MAG: ABC transporter substrate-binding protein [Flavobacteriaceae bacterium]|jgi:iron complex transport system substrate-binding protein|nr:ABC transporter substrate-binding protein [Flavobacteriaceae bacterium]